MSNLVPDYLSLWQTRKIIGAVGKKAGGIKSVTFILIDLIITSLIAFVIPFFIFFAVGEGMTNLLKYFGFLVRTGLTLIPPDPGSGKITLGIVIYSTYFTSAWLILHLTSIFLVRLGSIVGVWSGKLKYFLNIEKPFGALGFITVGFLTFMFLLAAPFVL